MAATLSQFYPWVAVDCPEVPVPLMDDAIRRGAREFAKISYALVQDVSLPMVVSTTDYALTLTAGTELLSIVSVNRPTSSTSTAIVFLEAKSQADIDKQVVATGPPSLYAVLETYPLSLRFYPTPTAVETFLIKTVVMPTTTVTSVDDKLFGWYVEGVTAYAKFWLMIQPNKAWSNPDGAAFAYRQFDGRVADARIRQQRFRAELPVQVQMQPFS